MQINTHISLSDTHEYQLHSAVLHMGSNTTKGQYCTMIRELSNQWVMIIDDTLLRGMTDQIADTILSTSAYLIMYQEVSIKHDCYSFIVNLLILSDYRSKMRKKI